MMDQDQNTSTEFKMYNGTVKNKRKLIEDTGIKRKRRRSSTKRFNKASQKGISSRKNTRTKCNNISTKVEEEEFEKDEEAGTNHNTSEDAMVKYNNNKKNNYRDHIIEDASNQTNLSHDEQVNILKNTTLTIPLENVALNSSLVKKYNLLVYSNGYDKNIPDISETRNGRNRKQKVENERKTVEIPKITITLNNNDSDTQNHVITSEEETTDINEKSLPVIESSPSTSETSVTNSTKSNNYKVLSKVLVNHYPTIKPFNITINVGAINQARKVQFSGKPINEHIEPVIPLAYLSAENDILSYDESILGYEESIPDLQLFSGDWIYDITDEDLYKISSSEIIFKNALLPPISIRENNDLLYARLSPASNTSSKVSVESEKDSAKTSSSFNCPFQFTKPILPPAKRPPTRKKKGSESTCSALSSIDSLSTVDKLLDSERSTTFSVIDDDAISLYSAWSIKTSDFCTKPTNSEREVIPEKFVMKENEPNSLIRKLPNCTNDKTELSKTNPTNVDNLLPDTWQKQNIMQWLETTEQPKFHVDFSTIPAVYRTLCYFYYTYGNCLSRKCLRKHSLTRLIHIEVSKLSHELLLDAYNYAKKRRKLFFGLFRTFISSFVRSNNTIDLISMVDDVVDPQNPRKYLQVKQIVEALESTGRSFVKCIEEIMMAQSGRDVILSDILFAIVYEQKQDLCANWYLIKKLCCYRNSCPLDCTIIDDLIKTCYTQANVELSVKVVKDIFMQNCVDLNAIDKLVFSHFIFFLKSKNLMEEVNILLGRAELSFSKNNPAWLENRLFINPIPENYNQEKIQNPDFHCKPISSFPSFDSSALTTSLTCNQTIQAKSYSNFNKEPVPEWTDNLFESVKQDCNKIISSNITRVEDMGNTSSDLDVEQTYTDSDESCRSFQESIANSTLQNAISTSTRSSPVTDRSLESSEKSLADYEIKKLSEILASNNVEALIAMYNEFKNSIFNNSFVMNVIGFLKQKNMSATYYLVRSLIDGLDQQNSHFAYINNADSTLYLLAINIIALLKQNKNYKDAARLLFKFNDNLDNLLKVQWFRSIQRHNLSIVGKYLYFCQIFIRGEYLQEAFTILKSPKLKLLNPISSWTLPHNEHFDNEFRNDVVDEFIKVSLKENLKIAKDIILHMITSKDNITELSLWRYFDELILGLLNSNGTCVTDLVNMLPNILQGWYKYLRKSNMRGLLAKLTSAKIPEKQLLNLYNKCLKQHIYYSLKANENTITLKTDMTLEEIFITIRYYLYKVEQSHYDIQEMTLIIKMPEQLSSQPQILINSGCRVQETKERILTVLARCFPTAILARSNGESQIVIRPDQIKLCVEYYKKLNAASNAIWVRQSAVEKLAISNTVPTTNTFNFSNALDNSCTYNKMQL